ncbi:MAG: hypothetical protein LAT54_02580 [Cryomorphaceae bacterium]|nr:hypothetical protein [Cryomorphaceae bacterium]
MRQPLHNYYRFLTVILIFFLSVDLHAQFDFTEDTNSIFIDNNQVHIDIMQPLLVTEIVTKDGKIYRGRLLDGPRADESSDFIIQVRRRKPIHIPANSVRQLAWAAGDRRDLNVFSEIGLTAGYASKNSIGFAPGVSGALGIELPYDVLFTFNGSITGLFADELYNGRDIFFAFGMGAGYRFNRGESHIQTLALNVDFSSGFYDYREPDMFSNYDPILQVIFSPTFDYEFPMTSSTGVSLFTRFQYFTQTPEFNHLIFGVAFRFYSGIPALGPLYNQQLLY